MARAKSLLKKLVVTQAKRTHNCKNNHSHQIKKGQWRLSVKEGYDTSNYCVECSKVFLANAKEEIEKILNKFNSI
jgi:hypothetical protein